MLCYACVPATDVAVAVAAALAAAATGTANADNTVNNGSRSKPKSCHMLWTSRHICQSLARTLDTKYGHWLILAASSWLSIHIDMH